MLNGNIIEKIHKLTNEIKSMDCYKSYEQYKQAVYSDLNLKSKIDNFRRLEIELEIAGNSSEQNADKYRELEDALLNLNSELLINYEAKGFLDSEEKLLSTISEITNEVLIQSGIDLDFIANGM